MMTLRKRLTDAGLNSARALVVRVNEKIAKLARHFGVSRSTIWRQDSTKDR